MRDPPGFGSRCRPIGPDDADPYGTAVAERERDLDRLLTFVDAAVVFVAEIYVDIGLSALAFVLLLIVATIRSP